MGRSLRVQTNVGSFPQVLYKNCQDPPALQVINNVSINFSTVEREERIKDLVEKIKAQRGNKAEKQKSKTVNDAMPKESAVVRRRRLYTGWLHRSSADSRYKQIKTKDGGGFRDFYYNDDEQITVESLKMKTRKLFFPEVVSKYGAIEDMQLDLGNYAQETISIFRDPQGVPKVRSSNFMHHNI